MTANQALRRQICQTLLELIAALLLFSILGF
jgi:hypothetical protein